jgi:cathepsin D
VTVQGTQVQISTGNASMAIIALGSTYISGPSQDVRNIWAAVPGSQALTGNLTGFYSFRKHSDDVFLFTKSVFLILNQPLACGTTVQISFSFGGSFWPISAADMNVELQIDAGGQQCIGAIIDIGNSSGDGIWVIGDAFLVRNNSPLHWNSRLNHKAIPQKNVYTVLRASPPSVGFAQLSISDRTTTTGIATATAYTSTTASQSSESPSSCSLNRTGTYI